MSLTGRCERSHLRSRTRFSHLRRRGSAPATHTGWFDGHIQICRVCSLEIVQASTPRCPPPNLQSEKISLMSKPTNVLECPRYSVTLSRFQLYKYDFVFEDFQHTSLFLARFKHPLYLEHISLNRRRPRTGWADRWRIGIHWSAGVQLPVHGRGKGRGIIASNCGCSLRNWYGDGARHAPVTRRSFRLYHYIHVP